MLIHTPIHHMVILKNGQESDGNAVWMHDTTVVPLTCIHSGS